MKIIFHAKRPAVVPHVSNLSTIFLLNELIMHDHIHIQLANEAIAKVQPTRFRKESHVVSQRMELYLTTEKVDDGFNIIIREGRNIQEAHVSTTLSRDEMKQILSNAASVVSVKG